MRNTTVLVEVRAKHLKQCFIMHLVRYLAKRSKREKLYGETLANGSE